MGQRMCNTTSVTDHIQSLMAAFQILIDLYFHIVEFYFHTIEKGIVICCTKRRKIKGSSINYNGRRICCSRY